MKKLLLLLLCVPLIFSCGKEENNEIGRYNFEIIEMMEPSFWNVLEEAGNTSPSMIASALMSEGTMIHVIFRFDTKTGDIKYFDLIGNEIEKEDLSKYKPLINPF